MIHKLSAALNTDISERRRHEALHPIMSKKSVTVLIHHCHERLNLTDHHSVHNTLSSHLRKNNLNIKHRVDINYFICCQNGCENRDGGCSEL
jgi:hypothetical protein